MHRKRIGKVYSLVIIMMIILSPLTSIFLWDGLKSVEAESPLTPVTTITGLNNDDNFGWNVSWVGDVNGDGYDDVIVGAPYTDRYTGGGDWWDNSWSYRRKLTFDNSEQTEDLENFPILVNLSSSNFDYSKAKLDGTDLRFIDADNVTELKYHIEDWNSSGYSYIWVNVTNIDGASSTDHICMYYGNPAASDIQDVSGTYDTNFMGVWHLNETGIGTRYDSTSNDYDGTPENYDGDEATTGKINGADEFNENHDIINVSTMNPQSYDNFTIEAWYKSNMDTGTNEGYMFDHGIDENVNPEIEMGFSDDFGYEDHLVLKILDNGVNANRYYGTSDIVDQQFHYLVAVRDDGRIKLYVDGVMETNDTDDDAGETISIDTGMGPYIGDFISTSEFLNGILDEVRVSDKARSSDWVKVQYLSMNSSFTTYASEESLSEDCGAAYIFFGYSGITLNNLNASNANVTIYSSNEGDLFGWSVADAGDVNKDGYDDIIIGAPGWGADRGRAYIFHGKTTSSWNTSYDADADADVILTGENNGDKFGFSVSGAGDMNNDGLSGEFYEGWSYRKKITLNSSKVADNLTDFPILISTIDTELKSRARSDGFDILFTESDGKTKLDHEVEKYNDSSGELVAWVKVPYLSPTTNTIMYMYYGNPIASDQSNPPGVWTNGYRGVWHLSETSGDALDSTSYGTNGTISGTLIQGDTGKIDGAYTLESNGNDNIDMGDPADGHLDFGLDNFTLSVWVKDYPYTNYQNVVFKGSRSSSFPTGYSLYHRPNDGEASWSIGDNTARVQNDFDWDQDGTWRYIVGVANRSSDLSHAYVNGVEQGTPVDISSVGSVDSDFNFAIPGSSSYLYATVDEIRISSGARSAEWIETEFNNQNDTGTFYTIGEEEVITLSWLYRKPITIKASQVTGDLTDFPVLIDISDSDLKSKARSDGYDIIFTDSDGRTKLDHEVERYNSDSGELIAWVKIPSLSSSTDTVIYMYYGNSMITFPTANPEGVWSNGYVGVYHMVEETGSIGNSASSTNDGTRVNTPTRASGHIGYGQEFTGSGTDDMFNIGNLGLADGVNENLTLSAWLNINNPALEDWAGVIIKRNDLDTDDIYEMYFDNSVPDKEIRGILTVIAQLVLQSIKVHGFMSCLPMMVQQEGST